MTSGFFACSEAVFDQTLPTALIPPIFPARILK